MYHKSQRCGGSLRTSSCWNSNAKLVQLVQETVLSGSYIVLCSNGDIGPISRWQQRGKRLTGVHAQQTVVKRCWYEMHAWKCMLAQLTCSGITRGKPAECCAAPGEQPHL